MARIGYAQRDNDTNAILARFIKATNLVATSHYAISTGEHWLTLTAPVYPWASEGEESVYSNF